MKTQIIKGISLLICIAMLVFSCKDSELEQVENNSIQDFSKNYVDETIKTNYVIKDGIVHFKDGETFKKLTKDLNKFTIDFDKDSNKFESYYEMVRLAQRKYNDAISNEQKANILSQYSSYINLKNNVAIPKWSVPFGKILNKDGVVIIGKIIYHFDGQNQNIIFDGDLKKVDLLNNKDYKNPAVMRISNISNMKSGRTLSNECEYLSGFTFGSNYDEQIYAACSGFFIFDRNSVPSGFVKVTAHVSTSGSSSSPSYYTGYVTPSSSLYVNYKAKVIINGIERGSIEPTVYIFNSLSYAFDNQQIGEIILTEAQLSNNFAQIIIEERQGNFGSGIGSVSYTCN